MQKGFILIFGALLGSYLPATAQTRPTQVYPMQEHNASIMRLMAAAPAHLPLAGSLRSEEHTSELQSRLHLVCRLLLEKKKKQKSTNNGHDYTTRSVAY